MIYTEPKITSGPVYWTKTTWVLCNSLGSSTTYVQACFHSCAHASAQLLSSAFICFRLLSPCFHHAFSLHLYSASIKPDSTMTSLLIASNRVDRYTLYVPTKSQTRHNIDHSKAKWCWFSTRACFRLACVCVQLWALAYISPSPWDVIILRVVVDWK